MRREGVASVWMCGVMGDTPFQTGAQEGLREVTFKSTPEKHQV